jgi:hypothetical protein
MTRRTISIAVPVAVHDARQAHDRSRRCPIRDDDDPGFRTPSNVALGDQ